MRSRIPLVLTAFLLGAGPGHATDAALTATPADAVALWQAEPTRIFAPDEIRLEDFRWVARPVIVFADTPADPRFREQVELLTARAEALADRDVVLILDTDPAASSDLRRKLRPRGFMLALIGKDGTVKLRKPSPWDVRELSRSIDKMPLRQEELRTRRSTPGEG